MDKLPVQCSWSKNAWMTAACIKWWFNNKFVPAVRKQQLEEKVILLLDNCPAHPPADTLVSKDGKIKVVYLPQNPTSKI